MSEFNQESSTESQSAKFDINAVIGNAKSVITAPAEYFKAMPTGGGLVDPLTFIVALAIASGVVSAVLSFFGSPVGMLAFGLAGIILVPIGALIGCFIVAGILFVIWKLMGSEMGYETSFRCVAALMAIAPINAVLSLVPYLGTIVGIGWATWLLIEASVAVHGRDRKTSQLVFGIIGLLMVFTNVSAEYSARHLSNEMEELGRILEKYQD